MSTNNGGAAFACASELGHQEGMSLRDWLAGRVQYTNADIETTMRAQGIIPEGTGGSYTLSQFMENKAIMRYLDADAMLAQRDKEATNGK